MLQRLSSRAKHLMTLCLLVLAGGSLSALLVRFLPQYPQLQLAIGSLVVLIAQQVHFTPKFGEGGYRAPVVHEPISEEQLRVLNAVHFPRVVKKQFAGPYILGDPHIGAFAFEEDESAPLPLGVA